MAGPTGPYNAGTVFLQVVPSFHGVQAAAKKAARDYADAFGKEYDKAFAGETDKGAKQAGRNIVKQAREAGKEGGDQAGGALADGIQRRLKSAIKSLPDIKIKADTTAADRNLALLRGRLREIQDAHAKVELDDAGAAEQIREILGRMRELNGQTANMSVRANTSVAIAELERVDAVVGQLDGQTAHVDVEVDGVGSAITGLGRVASAVRSVNGKKAKVAVDTNDAKKGIPILSRLGTSADTAGRRAGVAGIAFRAFNGWVLLFTTIGPAAIPVAAGLAAALVSVGVGASGAVAGLGVFVLGLSGVMDAVKAMGQVADNSAKDTLQASRTMRIAARGVRDAQTALARARVSAGEQIADAARAEVDAEERLADAQRDARKAQQDLTQARVDAARILEDLQNRNAEGALAERQAVIDLFNATVHFRNTMGDPGATNLEKEQASIDIESAKLHLKELRTENQRNGQEEKKRVKQGIDGSDEVTSAQERIRTALQAQADAQQGVADAARNSARVQRDAANSVADAQQALADAQLNYQERLQKTADIGSSSMDALNTAMGKLGPTQQAFARWLFGLRQGFFDLREIAAAGFLPELQAGLQSLIDTYGPGFRTFVSDISDALGGLIAKATAMFQSPEWKSIFSTFAELAPTFLKQFGEFSLNMLTVFGLIMQAFAPLAKDFGDAAVAFSRQLVAWVQEWTKSKGFQDFMAYLRKEGPKIMKFIEALAGALVALVIALAPYADQILGLLTGFLEWIAGMDPETLRDLVVSFVILAGAFEAIAGLVGVIGAIGGVIALLGAPIAGVVLLVIIGIVAGLILLATHWDTVKKVALIVWNAIATAATWLWEHVLQPIFNGIAALFKWVGEQMMLVWNIFLRPLFQFFISLVVVLYRITLEPIFRLIAWAFRGMAKGMKWVWEHWLQPLFSWFGDIWAKDVQPKIDAGISAIGDAFASLRDLAKEPIRFIVDTVLNNGLIKGWNKIATALDAPTIDPIELPASFYTSEVAKRRAARAAPQRKAGFHGHAATGAIVPGYTPGRDIGYIGVSGGEAIMRPEWTRAMGPDMVNEMNRVARTGGVDAVKRFLGMFASGGIVSWKGKRYTHEMVERMQLAQRLAHADFRISQGGFRPPTSYSGTTHGKDAVDITSPITVAVVNALRRSSIAAWHRTPAQGPWGHHIHGVPLPGGGVQLSPSALAQTVSYMHGGDGLGGNDSGKGGVIGAILGAAGWLKDAIAKPASWLRSQITGKLDKLGDSGFAKILKAVPEKLIHIMTDSIGHLLSGGDEPGLGTGAAKGIVQKLAASRGWGSGAQWEALQRLVQGESSWNTRAQNPASTAYGLFQFLNSTWAGVGGHKTSDARLQGIYGLRYIANKYGTPVNAYHKWLSRSPHWYSEGGIVPKDIGDTPDLYDNGGMIPPGLSTVMNLTGRPEPVLTPDQWDTLSGSRGGFNVTIPVANYHSPDDIADALNFAYRRISRGGVYAHAHP